MDGIILSQAEYLVFLDALNCKGIIGIDSQRLFPADIEKHRALIHQGIAQLQQRGWMQIQNGRHILSRDLLHLMNTIAHPEWVINTLLTTTEGQRQFLHYQSQGRFAEQTFPTEAQYRVGQLPDWETLIGRILQLLPFQTTAPTPPLHFEMARPLWLALLKLKAPVTQAHIAALLQAHNLPPQNLESIAALLTAVHAATFTGIMTIHHCADKRCRLVVNSSLIQGQTSAWKVEDPPAAQSVNVQTLDALSFRQYILQTVTT